MASPVTWQGRICGFTFTLERLGLDGRYKNCSKWLCDAPLVNINPPAPTVLDHGSLASRPTSQGNCRCILSRGVDIFGSARPPKCTRKQYFHVISQFLISSENPPKFYSFEPTSAQPEVNLGQLDPNLVSDFSPSAASLAQVGLQVGPRRPMFRRHPQLPYSSTSKLSPTDNNMGRVVLVAKPLE